MSPGPPVAVLLNPTAGRRRHGDLGQAVLAALRAGLAEGGATNTDDLVRPIVAHTASEAERRCRDAVESGVAAIIAVGGDGTMHTALQAVAGTSTPLGIVPAGTGNDFAAELGLPTRPLDAARRIGAALAAGRTRLVDVAEIDGPGGYRRWFGAVLAAGFDSIVNERANAMRWPRGRLRYDLATYAELARLRPRHYRLVVDGTPRDVDAVLVAVGNTGSYGGGMRICPTADPTDGQLDLVVAGPVSRATLVRIKPQVYRGTHVTHPQVLTVRAGELRIGCEEPITCYVDGERACPLPVTVTARAGALTLLD